MDLVSHLRILHDQGKQPTNSWEREQLLLNTKCKPCKYGLYRCTRYRYFTVQPAYSNKHDIINLSKTLTQVGLSRSEYYS